MLTDIQKEQLRLVIQQNPDPSYMAQLSASDDFALSELATQVPILINNLTNQISGLQNQITFLQGNLTILQG